LSEPTPPPVDVRRAPASASSGSAGFGARRAYFLAWLLSALALAAAGLFDHAKRSVQPVLDGKAHLPDHASFVGVLAFDAFLALLALPTLFLLRTLPETSRSSGVRLLRRVLLGTLCGLLLSALLAACIAASGKADEPLVQMLGAAGSIAGFSAGLVDSIALDAAD